MYHCPVMFYAFLFLTKSVFASESFLKNAQISDSGKTMYLPTFLLPFLCSHQVSLAFMTNLPQGNFLVCEEYIRYLKAYHFQTKRPSPFLPTVIQEFCHPSSLPKLLGKNPVVSQSINEPNIILP